MDANEVFRFVLAAALMPVAFTLGRDLRLGKARSWFVVAMMAMLLAFLGMVFKSEATWLWLRIARHVALAVGGAGLAVAAWHVRRQVLGLERVGD